MLTKNCRKSESSLSLHFENTVTEETNLRPIIAMHIDERFLSQAQKWILREKHAQRAFKLAEIRMHKPTDT